MTTENINEASSSLTVPVVFQDTSTDCAICLLPLEDEEETEVITLSCGHRWHFSCIQEQLEHAKPNPSKRLVFTGCTCAKCGMVCDHPKLRHLTRKVDSLRSKVQELIQEQLKIENDESDNEDDENDTEDDGKNQDTRTSIASTANSNTIRESRMDRAWRKYAFYLCSNCHEPYFGGTIECADQPEGELVAAKDRLCVACSSPATSNTTDASNNNDDTTITPCTNRAQHRSFLVWKCRFCCQPSTYVCYGSVHFCNSCHARNTRRVQELRRLRQQGLQSSSSSSSKPPPLKPIACPGGTACPFPKPNGGEDFHVNAPTSDGEQIYGCTLCQSSSNSQSSRWDIPPGSQNFIINPSGLEGFYGWQHLSTTGSRRGMTWQVEQSNLPVIPAISPQHQQPPHVTTNFVSSFTWCSMAQRVPLSEYVRDPSQVQIEVAAQYKGRTDCPSVFRLEAVILNSQNRPVHRASTPILNAPQDDWDRASLILGIPDNNIADTHSLIFIVHGKDGRFWQGLFGAKVADCSVRVLGSTQVLEEHLLTDTGPEAGEDNHNRGGDLLRRRRQQQHQGRGFNVNDGRQQPYNDRRQIQGNGNAWSLLVQGILPLVCFLLLFWLLSD